MAKPVDLLRYRRACAALDKIVAHHPELRQGGGKWADNLQELDRMTQTTVAERVKAFRSRKRADGWKQTTVYLSPDAQARLTALQQQFPGYSVNDLINLALVRDSRLIDPAGSYQTTQQAAPSPASGRQNVMATDSHETIMNRDATDSHETDG